MFGDLGVNDFSVPGMLLFDLAGAFSGKVYSGTFVLATFDFVALGSDTAVFTGLFESFVELSLNFNIYANTPTFGVAPATVSEPSVMAILMMGLVVLGLSRRMK